MIQPISAPPAARRRRRAVAVLVLVAGATLGGLAATAPASAHNYVVSSTPAEGAALTALPESFEITTNDALLDLGGETGGFALQVVGPDGLYYGDGCITVEGATMSAVPALGPAGAYTATWQVVSADGHTVDGTIPFTWAPADTSVATSGSAEPPVCGATEPEPEPTPTVEPSPSTSPSPSASDGAASGDDTTSESTGGSTSGDGAPDLALIIGAGVLAAAAGGAIIYLLLARAKKT